MIMSTSPFEGLNNKLRSVSGPGDYTTAGTHQVAAVVVEAIIRTA